MDIADYLREYAVVKEYSISRDAPMPYYTWESMQPQYAYTSSVRAMAEIKLILPVYDKETGEALREWMGGHMPKGMLEKLPTREPDGKDLVLKASQVALKKLGEEKKALEAKVLDLETRLTALIGVLR